MKRLNNLPIISLNRVTSAIGIVFFLAMMIFRYRPFTSLKLSTSRTVNVFQEVWEEVVCTHRCTKTQPSLSSPSPETSSSNTVASLFSPNRIFRLRSAHCFASLDIYLPIGVAKSPTRWPSCICSSQVGWRIAGK